MLLESTSPTVKVCQGTIGVAIIAVAGEIDALTCTEVDSVLLLTVYQRKHKAVIVDLRGVTFMGARGVATLLRARDAAETGTSFCVVASTRSVLRPIQLCGADQTLSVSTTLREAFTALPDCSATA